MEAQPHLEEPEKRLKKNKPRSKRCFTAWAAIGLLLITWISLLVGFSYLWLKNRDEIKNYQNQQSSLQTQILKNQAENNTLQQRVKQLENFIEQKFSSHDNRILLSNAHHLIQLAQYNLIYFHDINTALSALTLANNQLGSIMSSDIQFEKLRQLLSQYLIRLKELPSTDLTAVFNQIDTLKKQVSRLPLLPSKNSLLVPSTESKANNTSEKKWQHKLRDSLNSFRQLIVIRRLNKPIEPLLPEIEQHYLQQNLHLLLQQVQWAFIHHETMIYQMSLQEFQTVIMEHFSTDSPLTQTVLQTINQLKQINLQSPFLDLNPLLEIIATIEKTQNTTFAVTANQKESS
ncbi:uroporphyrinogen-III C-methyltransferase [Rickettsiella grylli]|uniref:Uroporphyrinogen-III C-methyltransferase n=1 Tax=Rickettsiella grylli TaxID=59196 RepID=A8PKZ1_9COXI|nr:uroporphyrinogen-III C-methyltransferase [Rickettsiella grylli]EDP46700.1 conserved hypothetical protein [Rickettsiella grylli]